MKRILAATAISLDMGELVFAQEGMGNSDVCFAVVAAES